MTQRVALLIAAALTGFVLVLAGTLAATVMQPSPPPAVVAPPIDPAPPASEGAATTDAFAAREAAYQQALDQARAQIVEANRRLEQANAQLAQVYQSQAVPAPATATPELPPASAPAPAADTVDATSGPGPYDAPLPPVQAAPAGAAQGIEQHENNDEGDD
jgi:hypothetical protein